MSFVQRRVANTASRITARQAEAYCAVKGAERCISERRRRSVSGVREVSTNAEVNGSDVCCSSVDFSTCISRRTNQGMQRTVSVLWRYPKSVMYSPNMCTTESQSCTASAS